MYGGTHLADPNIERDTRLGAMRAAEPQQPGRADAVSAAGDRAELAARAEQARRARPTGRPVRIYVIAAESREPLDIQVVKKPGAEVTASMQCVAFDAFAALDDRGVADFCRQLATAIGRPDLAEGIGR